MVEMMDGTVGKRSVEHVMYVINNLLHLDIVKYGVISLVLISARLRLVTILTSLVKYLVIYHADPCNKSYISRKISIEHPSVGARFARPISNYHLSWLAMLSICGLFSLMIARLLVKEVMLVFNGDSDDDFVDTLMKNVKETLEYVNTDKQ